MTAVDLEGIDPSRREEIARRVAVLERYTAIGLADAVDDAAFAAEMGLGVGQFLRLARIWREHRRPDLLPGARKRDNSASDVDGPNDATGIAAAVPAEPSGDISMDEAALNIPVRLASKRALPILHLLTDEVGGRPLAWSLESGRMNTTSAARLLLSLPPTGRPLRRVSLTAELASSALADLLLHAGLDVEARRQSGRLGIDARRILGPTVGGFALRTRANLRVDARADALAAGLSLDHAREALRSSLEGIPGPVVGVSLPDGDVGERLRGELNRLAGAAA